MALGPDLPALFVNDDDFAGRLLECGQLVSDPLWRMPLWKHYDEMLSSDIADLSNVSDAPLAGAVTAALFLQRFVPEETPWAHFDTFAWRPSAKPAGPRAATRSACVPPGRCCGRATRAERKARLARLGGPFNVDTAAPSWIRRTGQAAGRSTLRRPAHFSQFS